MSTEKILDEIVGEPERYVTYTGEAWAAYHRRKGCTDGDAPAYIPLHKKRVPKKLLVLEPLYQPGDTVRILALERDGCVRLIRFDGHQVEFFVNYWEEGKRLGEWLFADEMEFRYGKEMEFGYGK